MTKIDSAYGLAVIKPEMTIMVTAIELTRMEKLRAKLIGVWRDIKYASYFAVSFTFFKFAVIGHF